MDYQTELDKIMDSFDFEKVHRAMCALDWEWYPLYGVPTTSELRVQARKLLTDAYDLGTASGRDYVVATGGFHALYDPKESYLELSFQVSNWSNHDG